MILSQEKRAVIALGGNAISPPDKVTNIAGQFRHTRQSLRELYKLIKRGYQIAIVHGNGPQVGAALRRVEMARHDLPDVPLGLLVADTEGSMGYMIEQSFQNVLSTEGVKKNVVTLVTQVLVGKDDPALKNPTKYIGRSFTAKEANYRIENEGWDMKPYGDSDSWRRVVGSPEPRSIINANIVRQLVDSGTILITAGGGGIPVYMDNALGLEGVDAVIDKDLAAAILAKEIDAEVFVIITNVDAVYLNFGKADQIRVPEMTARTALEHLADGQFPAGSMGPKIKAAADFLKNGGRKVIICDIKQVDKAFENQAGTIIIP